MTDTKNTPTETIEPTEPGFYYSEGAAQVMIYLRAASGQWHAIIDNGDGGPCVWGYIEQTLGAYPLRRLDANTHAGAAS